MDYSVCELSLVCGLSSHFDLANIYPEASATMNRLHTMFTLAIRERRDVTARAEGGEGLGKR